MSARTDLVLFCAVTLLLICNACVFYTPPYELPVFPESFPPFDQEKFALPFTAPLNSANTTKLIPRNMWVAFKTRPEALEELSDELQSMIDQARKDGWAVYCLGHKEQILFMETYYANTSLLWEIKMT